MTTYLHRERDGEEAISNISLAAWRMFDRMARASEYGRVISPGNQQSVVSSCWLLVFRDGCAND